MIRGQVVGKGTREETGIEIQVTEECYSVTLVHLPCADHCCVLGILRGSGQTALPSSGACKGPKGDRMERVSRLERC